MAKVTPPRLHSALRAVKEYVIRMPDGVSLTQLCLKVKQYSDLCRQDKQLLIDIIDDNEILTVTKSGKAKNLKVVLHHRKYGHSDATPVLQENQIIAPETPKEEPMTITVKMTPEEMRRHAEEGHVFNELIPHQT